MHRALTLHSGCFVLFTKFHSLVQCFLLLRTWWTLRVSPSTPNELGMCAQPGNRVHTAWLATVIRQSFLACCAVYSTDAHPVIGCISLRYLLFLRARGICADILLSHLAEAPHSGGGDKEFWLTNYENKRKSTRKSTTDIQDQSEGIAKNKNH